MHHDLYSNTEFTKMKEQINEEILRRGTFSWWDPLTTPAVGQNKIPPTTLPDDASRMTVTDKTYTINNPSENSIEPTRNIIHDQHGDNPAGNNSNSSTSAAGFNVDEARNYLVGLSKIMDIPLFYGRDELPGTAFRNPEGIANVIKAAQESELNRPLSQTDLSPIKIRKDGTSINYNLEDGQFVMPSGGYDGEETVKSGPDETNFFDDHGAPVIDSGEKTPDGQPILISDHNYHPMNPHISERIKRVWNDIDRGRNDQAVKFEEGGKPSSRFGPNPRNPQQGNQYRSRPVFGGVLGACNVACTGLCYTTCDNECSESCQQTCWSNCGDACTTTCGNICTGCTTMCYTSCKTKCEDTQGFSCLQAGAKTVKITAEGASQGVGPYPKNTISFTKYTCQGCAYTCQFWPNKRTECFDAACQQLCFTSCRNYCSTSCFGGCVDNKSQNSGYKTGIGRACSAGCTVNCVGNCFGVCEGECVQECWHACKQHCHDNCSWECSTFCGSGCADRCTKGCTGCDLECSNGCKGKSNSTICKGCSGSGGCASTCQHDCNHNCIGWGCRSICGIESAGACEANCRLNCMGASCTSICGNACASHCTACVNTCGHQCGACSSQCSIGCGAECNITCTEACQHSCDSYCYFNCTEECGGCSNLCYSCVGMCIGVCSVKCDNGCSSCSLNCGWWCDHSCGRHCFANCVDRCISSCSGGCQTSVMSDTSSGVTGAERPPTSIGYKCPNPQNRKEEQESFRLYNGEDGRIVKSDDNDDDYTKSYLIEIFVDDDNNLCFIGPPELEWVIKSTTAIGGVYVLDGDQIIIIEEALRAIIDPDDFYKRYNPKFYEYDDGIFIIIIKDNPSLQYDPLEDIRVTLPFEFTSLLPIRTANRDVIILIARKDFGIDDPLRVR